MKKISMAIIAVIMLGGVLGCEPPKAEKPVSHAEQEIINENRAQYRETVRTSSAHGTAIAPSAQ